VNFQLLKYLTKKIISAHLRKNSLELSDFIEIKTKKLSYIKKQRNYNNQKQNLSFYLEKQTLFNSIINNF
jgi:hypothetical protein